MKGCIIDGITIQFLNSLTSCYSSKDNAVYGDTSVMIAAISCSNDNHVSSEPISHHNYCDCVLPAKSCSYQPFMTCSTVFAENNLYSCFGSFELLGSSSHCDQLMGQPNSFFIVTMASSTAVNATISFFLIVLIALCIAQVFQDSKVQKSRKLSDGSSVLYDVVAITDQDL